MMKRAWVCKNDRYDDDAAAESNAFYVANEIMEGSRCPMVAGRKIRRAVGQDRVGLPDTSRPPFLSNKIDLKDSGNANDNPRHLCIGPLAIKWSTLAFFDLSRAALFGSSPLLLLLPFRFSSSAIAYSQPCVFLSPSSPQPVSPP